GFVQRRGGGDGQANLRHFQTMGKAHPVMGAVGGDKNLRFVAQASKGDRVDDPVAVALEIVTRSADSPAILQTSILASARMGAAFIIAAAPASLRVAGIALYLSPPFSLFTSLPSLLTQAHPSPPT